MWTLTELTSPPTKRGITIANKRQRRIFVTQVLVTICTWENWRWIWMLFLAKSHFVPAATRGQRWENLNLSKLQWLGSKQYQWMKAGFASYHCSGDLCISFSSQWLPWWSCTSQFTPQMPNLLDSISIANTNRQYCVDSCHPLYLL